jgi:hypothetical protein
MDTIIGLNQDIAVGSVHSGVSTSGIGKVLERERATLRTAFPAPYYACEKVPRVSSRSLVRYRVNH